MTKCKHCGHDSYNVLPNLLIFILPALLIGDSHPIVFAALIWLMLAYFVYLMLYDFGKVKGTFVWLKKEEE